MIYSLYKVLPRSRLANTYLPFFSFSSENFEKQKNKSLKKKAALLSAKVINMISEYPNMTELRKQSLRQRIINEISKKQYQQVSNRLKSIFINGVELKKSIYSQHRLLSAASNYKKNQLQVVFSPTHFVTGQIFRNLQSSGLCQVSYGHYGIAKSFSYILYQKLTDIIVEYLISLQNAKQFDSWMIQLKQICPGKQEQQLYFPKILYWSLDPQKVMENKIFNEHFSDQCSQIPQQKKPQLKKNSSNYIMELTSYYQKKQISVYIIIDQLNSIASAFRRGIQLSQILQKKSKTQQQNKINKIPKYLTQSQKQLIQHQNQIKLLQNNSFEIIKQKQTILSYFNKVIYNSSVNIQSPSVPQQNRKSKSFIDLTAQLQQKAIQRSNIQQKIQQLLKISPQPKHYPFYYTSRIIYPQISSLESSIFQLTDIFMFQLTRKKINNDKNLISMQNDRHTYNEIKNQVFKQLKQLRRSSIITPLLITDSMAELQGPLNVKQFVQKTINRLKYKSQEQLLKKFNNFINKKVNDQSRLELKAIIYINLYTTISQKQKQKQQKQFQSKERNKNLQIVTKEELSKNIKDKIFQQLYFLKNKILFFKSGSILPDALVNIDRRFFIGFQNAQELKHYINKILYISLKSSQQYQNIEKNYQNKQLLTYIRQEYKKWFQELYNTVIQGTQGQFPLGFYFIPIEKIMQKLQKSLYLIIEKRTNFFKQIFHTFGPYGSGFGIMIENFLKRGLAFQNQIKIADQIYKIDNKCTFSSFPTIKMKDRQKLLENFFFQFIKILKNRQRQYIYFTPIKLDKQNNFNIQKMTQNQLKYSLKNQSSNSKVVDFVITQQTNFSLKIKFFDVTVAQDKSNLINKFEKFFQAYSQVVKKSWQKLYPDKTLEVQYFLITTRRNKFRLQQVVEQYLLSIKNWKKMYQYFEDDKLQHQFTKNLEEEIYQIISRYPKDDNSWKSEVINKLKMIILNAKIVVEKYLKEKNLQARQKASKITKETITIIKQEKYKYLMSVNCYSFDEISFPIQNYHSKNYQALKTLDKDFNK